MRWWPSEWLLQCWFDLSSHAIPHSEKQRHVVSFGGTMKFRAANKQDRSSLAELITRTETTADRVLLTELGERLSTPDLLTKRQAADFLTSAVRTLDDWRQQKKIPVIKCGGYIRFRREDLESFLESHTLEARKASAYRPRRWKSQTTNPGTTPDAIDATHARLSQIWRPE